MAPGLCIEIMNLLEAKENFKFVYKSAFTAPKVIETNMESGAADIHFGWAKTPEREKIACQKFCVQGITIHQRSFHASQ
jgi:hypothetical protein